MDTFEKLAVLSDSAKYDASCVSSGSSRKNTKNGIGNTAATGICHSYAGDGRCISLLKILMTNSCIYDCAYCINRVSNDIQRTSFTPEEIADLTIQFYKRNYIEGLFLSSGVIKNADYTMELIIKTLKLLRDVYKFNGYIHTKVIPGADSALVSRVGELADRLSVNIELPSESSLKLLAPQKSKSSILKPMGYISTKILEPGKSFAPAGQSTQLIVGATPERDYDIIRLTENLYKKYGLRRVFYSAYINVGNNLITNSIQKPPLAREHRLYQADWLLRFYNFTADELLDDSNRNFNTQLDPKCDWALRNLHLFPMEINKVNYRMLLRIPGIGMQSAKRIIAARRIHALDFSDLKKLGVVLKRAIYFIICKGKPAQGMKQDTEYIKACLCLKDSYKGIDNQYLQPSLFTGLVDDTNQNIYKALTGDM